MDFAGIITAVESGLFIVCSRDGVDRTSSSARSRDGGDS